MGVPWLEVNLRNVCIWVLMFISRNVVLINTEEGIASSCIVAAMGALRMKMILWRMTRHLFIPRFLGVDPN